MDKTSDEARKSVYEIGYLLVPSVPEDQAATEGQKIGEIAEKAGASIVSQEGPRRRHLAYSIRRKTLAGAYDAFDEAYFGWVKFEVGTGEIEAVKKAVAALPAVLRFLLITTVRENTYLGKSATLSPYQGAANREEAPAGVGPLSEAVPAASVEDMDKSIDAMVKES